jgi:transposase
MLHENPHTPPSKRLYITRTSGITKSNNGKRYPGRPKGHIGQTRPKPKIPDIIKEPEKKTTCNHCGAPLKETHIQHHLIEEINNRQPRQVIDFLHFEYKCTCCNAHITSRHPDCPPDGIFGKNALIQTSLMKFEQRLPFDKISEQMEQQFGLSMTSASAFEVTNRVSHYLRPEYAAIVEKVRAAEVVNVDETGLKIDGKRAWLWVFVVASATLFVVSKSRGKRVLLQVLGADFEGYLGCDGWRSYANFTDRFQRCWAHLLREAKALSEHYGDAEPLFLGLKRLYFDVQVWLEGKPSLEVRGRLKVRAERRLRYYLRKDYESAEVKRFVVKVRNGFDHWFTFVVVPEIEATNNRAERALRESVVQRKIMGTFRNEKGTQIYETMMTLLATWKQQKLNPWKAMDKSLTTAWTKS